MRKIIFILLAIALIIPLCAVPVSATTFEFSSPKKLVYSEVLNRDYDTFLYFNQYHIYSEDDSIVYSGAINSFPYLAYSKLSNGVKVDSFQFGSYIGDAPVGLTYLYDSSKSYLHGTIKSDVSNRLIFASFAYDGLILPVTGQYLKVTIRFSSFLESFPSEYNKYLDAFNFCYLCDDYAPGIIDTYSQPRLLASTVVVNDLGSNMYEYQYFFNYNGIDSSLFSSDNISLAIRIPFYFSENSKYNNGVSFWINADLPDTYEILTVGGYDEQLNSIENAIESSNEKLIDLYTKQDDADKTHVLQIQQSNVELDQGIKDYQSAAAPVEQIRDNFTTPPLNDMVDKSFQDFSPSGVKNIFSLPWIISAVGLVFSFCVIRLILYGTKEG